MRKHKRVRFAGLGLATAALLVAGCQTTLNDENLETAISSWIVERGGEQAVVTCPDDRPVQQGDTFPCVATFGDGSTATFQVTQTDNTGNVSWQLIDE